MLRCLLAVILLFNLEACSALHGRDEAADWSGYDALPARVAYPPEGALSDLGVATVVSRVVEPATDWYVAQYGPGGITPYVTPGLESGEAGEVRNPESELLAWVGRSEGHTLVVLGQDDLGGEGLLAHLVHRLGTAAVERRGGPVPLLVEMCQLLDSSERGRPHSRVELAMRALERRTGTRPDPGAVAADLRARALVLVVTDFDRLAEWVGPAAALSVFQGLRSGPGKLVMRARPTWFRSARRQELELVGPVEGTVGREGGRERDRGTGEADPAWLVLTPLSRDALSGAVARLRPEGPGFDVLARYSTLVELARRPGLTSIILDILEDPLLLEDVIADPQLFRIHESWTRWEMEQRLGEGRVSLVEAAEQALTHLAGRIYDTGRLRLHPTGAKEKALLEAQVAGPLCAPDAFLDCGEFGYRFRQGRWLDYFAARSLRDQVVREGRVDPQALQEVLGRRRPGAGTMAMLAVTLSSIPDLDTALLQTLSLEAARHCRAGTLSGGGPAHATEAVLRLRYLREGIVHPDGSLPAGAADRVTPILAAHRNVQDFWRRAFSREEARLHREGRAQLEKFLASRQGRRYRPLSSHRLLLRDTNGVDWAFVPAGCGIVGSYFSPDEEPVRWSQVTKPFLLAIKPVTNRDFKSFVEDGGYSPHPPWLSAPWARFLASWREDSGQLSTYPEGHADYPVVNVSWLDVQAYLAWRSRRDGVATNLPAADEWEYAARGGLGRLYPWGDLFDPARCNSAEGARWQVSAVGSFAGSGAGPFGNLDLAGNVWEWTATPFTPAGGAPPPDAQTLVGGGWRSTGPEVRSSRRLMGVTMGRYDVVGFRLKRDLEASARD